MPLMAALFAVGLLSAVAPRLLAATEIAEYGRIGQRLGRGELDGRELSSAIADYREALSWFDSGAYRGDLGQVYFAAARFYADDTKRRLALVDRAAMLDIEALRRDPGQPFLWSQLAVALAQTRGLDVTFAKVLKQAILAAPRTRPLVFARADLGIRAWPRLDEELRALVKEQVVQAVEIDPRRLRRHLPGPNHRRLVRHLLAEDRALVERFLRY
jgi:hypothetical protein